ncbi:10351_t:CDS:2, partial [Gigaspora rosea]
CVGPIQIKFEFESSLLLDISKEERATIYSAELNEQGLEMDVGINN